MKLDFPTLGKQCHSYLVDKAGFPHVREATDEKRPGVRVYGRETRQVLPNLLEVCQTLVLSLHYCAHPEITVSISIYHGSHFSGMKKFPDFFQYFLPFFQYFLWSDQIELKQEEWVTVYVEHFTLQLMWDI